MASRCAGAGHWRCCAPSARAPAWATASPEKGQGAAAGSTASTPGAACHCSAPPAYSACCTRCASGTGDARSTNSAPAPSAVPWLLAQRAGLARPSSSTQAGPPPAASTPSGIGSTPWPLNANQSGVSWAWPPCVASPAGCSRHSSCTVSPGACCTVRQAGPSARSTGAGAPGAGGSAVWSAQPPGRCSAVWLRLPAGNRSRTSSPGGPSARLPSWAVTCHSALQALVSPTPWALARAAASSSAQPAARRVTTRAARRTAGWASGTRGMRHGGPAGAGPVDRAGELSRCRGPARPAPPRW